MLSFPIDAFAAISAMSSTGTCEYLPNVVLQSGQAVTIASGDAAVRLTIAFSASLFLW